MAEKAKTALLAKGLLDGRLRPRREGDEILLPLRARDADAESVARDYGGRIIEAALEPRETPRDPHDALRESLTGIVPRAFLKELPRRWERVGNVLLVKPLHPALEPFAARVGAALAEILDVKSVLEDHGGVIGEYREMLATRALYGTDTITTHREHGIAYRFDAARLMFSSGNVEERKRMGELDARGEVIADMFAGIGYFALPVAKKTGAARVVAMEKNPLAHGFLATNVALNGVAEIVEPWLGDNREYPESDFADRVLLGYFPGTEAFLPTALRFARPEGATLHYHDKIPMDEIHELPRRVAAACETAGCVATPLTTRIVKTYAPGIGHAVADVHVAARR